MDNSNPSLIKWNNCFLFYKSQNEINAAIEFK